MKMVEISPFRRIQASDNEGVARLIREVMTSEGLVGEGYSINDPEVNNMYTAYRAENRAAFFVYGEADEEYLGCGGIAQLVGADPSICELRKMYFQPKLRGKGLGKVLLSGLIDLACQLGYNQIYLETTCSLTAAIGLYERFGFERLTAPLGNTGHSVCDVRMLRSTC